ncbi:MAG: metallophosphoesterase family protein [Promethearchaeota archaeon]
MRPYKKMYIPSFIQKFIENPDKYMIMHDISPFSLMQIGEIWSRYEEIAKKYSNLVVLKDISSNFKNMLIVGDTHGDFESTLRIVQPFLEEKVDGLLFLGDYVDRGEYSFLNLMFLICLSIVWPDRVILLRGNHEDLELNVIFGFYGELQRYFKNNQRFQAVLAIIDALYNLMSLVAITPEKSVCMHAGITKDLVKLNIIKKLPKPHKDYQNIEDLSLKQKLGKILYEFRWNDPLDKELDDPNEKSYHGYEYFTKEEVRQFLKLNKMKRIIKSHEDIRGGFAEIFPHQLYHVFSSEPYFGKIEKAFTINEQKNHQIWARDLDFNHFTILKKK